LRAGLTTVVKTQISFKFNWLRKTIYRLLRHAKASDEAARKAGEPRLPLGIAGGQPNIVQLLTADLGTSPGIGYAARPELLRGPFAEQAATAGSPRGPCQISRLSRMALCDWRMRHCFSSDLARPLPGKGE
jgi:hypothetical protein